MEKRVTSLEAAVDALSERLDGVERRTAALEAGLLRVERQLHLVFEQGQAFARVQGDHTVALNGLRETLDAVAMRLLRE